MSDRPSTKEEEEFLLPAEVIMEILSKLPAMSVLRFHCVSKQWFSILRDEYFCNLHSEVLLRPGSPLRSYCKIQFSTVQSQQKQTFITFSSPGSTSHRSIKIFSHTNDRDAVSAVNCMWRPALQCNGLVGMVPYKKLREQPILVCNPLTLEYLALRPCTTSNFFISVGLGFAPLSKQYKVVCIHHFVYAPSEQVNYPPWAGEVMKVYTLGDTTWRVVDPHMDFKPWCFTSSGLYADGKIYWVLWGPHPIKYSIFSFDVESEKGRVIGFPPIAAAGQGLEIKLYDFKLVHLDSGVSVFIIRGHVIEVWMLKEYCCSSNDGGNCLWNLRQKIKLPDDFVGAGGRGSVRYRPLGTWESGDDVLVIAVKISSDREITNRVFYYQVSSSTGWCEPVEFSMDYLPESMSDWYPCYGYKPSLVSLKRYALQEKK